MPSSSVTRVRSVAAMAVLALALAACGGSSKPKASTETTPTAAAPATTSTATTTTPARAKKRPRAHKKQSASTTTTPTTTAPKSKSASKPTGPSTPKSHGTPVQPLPIPIVAAQAGGLRASLHGENHDPTANRLWHYSVLATDSSGGPLSGTVDSEFVFGGQVVGRESPPTHPLKNGRLDDSVTFPARSIGIPLTFQVVIHTKVGSVTLDWPVKPKR